MSAETVRAAIESSLSAGHFFVAPPGRLRVEHVTDEQVPWETFHGHLLAAVQTTQARRFESWHVFVDNDGSQSAAPLLVVHWDHERGVLLIVRQILTYGFVAYEDPPGVILSRPAENWVRELVGTIELARLYSGDELAELRMHLFLAVIGTSRLPITSLESPLPAFSLGKLAYLPALGESSQPWTDAIAMLRVALDGGAPLIERAKSLETALRAIPTDRLTPLATALRDYALGDPSGLDRLGELFQALFNNVALSPYTEFVDRIIATLLELAHSERVGVEPVVDILSYMLRHLCRHLTAYDLTLFHNFGANYPDALFLDALLKANLRLIEDNAQLWLDRGDDPERVKRTKRGRRRALRQACLVRKHYEGHAVPDAPTSMGENLRVLPARFARVPEEQIVHTAKRRRTLFAGEPLDGILSAGAKAVLRAAVCDLDLAPELRELGTAQFLDRPLGVGKQSGEVDRTPLMSSQAFSRTIVKRRLGALQSAGWMSLDDHDRYSAAADHMRVAGVAASSLLVVDRPRVVTLADALKAAPDFMFLRTTGGSGLAGFLALYDFAPLRNLAPRELDWLLVDGQGLLVHHVAVERAPATPTIRIYDLDGRMRLELGLAAEPHRGIPYQLLRGVEMVERLHVIRIWEAGESDQLVERDVRERGVWLNLREAFAAGHVERERLEPRAAGNDIGSHQLERSCTERLP